jgi:hypothetical protein
MKGKGLGEEGAMIRGRVARCGEVEILMREGLQKALE